MNRVAVQSTSISSVGYDVETADLEVEYVNGRVYRYFHVPQAAFRLLLQAPSKGVFVNQVIKPRFRALRVGAV